MLTAEQRENLAKVFDKKAEKEQTLVAIVGKVATALTTDILTKGWVKDIIGESGSKERSRFCRAVPYFLPHYVLNGSAKCIACDFILATEENMDSKTIRQYRLSSDEEVVKVDVCKNYVETLREESKMEKVRFESGFEMEVPSRDVEGKIIREVKKVQLVPRKKTVFGFTKDMKTAIINAVDFIEEGGDIEAILKESK